jgi:mannose-6-phosphate isomerase-like protein (cupin superfamily)
MNTYLHRLAPVSAFGLASFLAVACAPRERVEQPVTVIPAPPAPAHGFITDIEQATVQNEFYRRVLFTAPYSQLTLMSLRPGEELGTMTFTNSDQFVSVETGTGYVTLDRQSYQIQDGSAMLIPAGVPFNIVNSGSAPLRFYVVSSPPVQAPNTVQPSKRDSPKPGHYHR